MSSAPIAGRRRPARHRHSFANLVVLALLRSPAHALVDAGMCELRYVGRASGRRYALPVMFARVDERLVVLVGDAPAKRWWRNFRAPGPVEVRHRGKVTPAVARILDPADDGYGVAVRAYTQRHNLVPEPTDRLLVIDPSEGV